MSSRFVPPFTDVGSGINPPSGAQLFFLETGSSTLKDTFSDQLSTPTKNSNPVIAGPTGIFGDIFITGKYKVVLKDKNGSQIWTADPIDEFVTGSGQLVNVLSRNTLNDAVIDTSLQDGLSINLKERTTSNGGGALWDVVLASTVTPNTFNIVICTGVPTLALVLRINQTITLSQFGVDTSGVGDATAGLLAFAAQSSGKDVNFDGVNILLLSAEVNFPSPRSIDYGDTTVNFDLANTFETITVGSTGVTLLHTTLAGSEATEFTREMTLDSVTNIVQGSMLSVWNPIDSSWLGFRTNYRQGEYVLVEEVNGSVVEFDGQLVDSYPTGSKVYLVDTVTCSLTGKLGFVNTGAYGTAFGLQVNQILDLDMTGLKVFGNNLTSTLELFRCMNVSGQSVKAFQQAAQVSGLNYGLSIRACQNLKVDGSFHADRHGTTTGSGDDDGEAINRYIEITGRITTSGLGSTPAADFHGNTEHSGYGGYLEGVRLGGHDTYILPGTKIVSPIVDIAPVQYSEMKSMQHSLGGAIIDGEGTPASRGIVDAGGSSDSFNAFTVLGGTLDFSGITITGATTTQSAIRVRNRGATVEFDINCDNIKIDVPSSGTGFVISAVSGDEVNSISFRNSQEWEKGISGASGIEYYGLELSGDGVLSPTTATNFITTLVTYTNSFPSGTTPKVIIQDDLFFLGGDITSIDVDVSINTRFTAVLYNTDGSNFAANGTSNFQWRAYL